MLEKVKDKAEAVRDGISKGISDSGDYMKEKLTEAKDAVGQLKDDAVQRLQGGEPQKFSGMLKNRIDVKADTIISFSAFLESLENKEAEGTAEPQVENRLILLTNFGQVAARLLPADETKHTENEQLMRKIFDMRDNYLEKKPPDALIVNNTASILLRDVVVTPFANPQVHVQYEVLSLFVDQIVGVTIGS